jgi:hypothetical protein
MRSIKLTPFILFLILLLVLVVAMIFGYKSSMVVEGNSNAWEPVTAATQTVAAYSSSNKLTTVLADADATFVFDPKNGNLVIQNTAAPTTYTLLTRESQGQTLSITTTATHTVNSTMDESSTPWSASILTKYTILYAPVNKSTLIIIIKNDSVETIFKNTGDVSSIFTLSNKSIGISGTTANPNRYTPPFTQTAEKIKLDGNDVNAIKIADNLYYEKNKGICVKSQTGTFNTATEYKTGVSKQTLNGDVLVLSTMVDNKIVVNLITKGGITPIYTLAYSIQLTEDDVDKKITGANSGTITLSVETPDAEKSSNDTTMNALLGIIREQLASGHSTSSSQTASSSQTVSYAPSVAQVATSGNESCSDSRYMLKTEVVPPVCPACPACPASSGCNLSISSNGEIVDCNGKKYTPSDLYKAAGSMSSSPGTWAGAAATGLQETGNVLEKTVDAAGNTITKTVGTAGNVVTTTVDTAGNIVGKTIDTASDLVKGAASGVSDIASGIGSGLASLGKGTADVVKSVSSDATGLISGAGSGLLGLAANAQYYQQQQQQSGYPQPQQPGYPQTQGYPQQQQGGYPQTQGYPQPQQPSYDYAYNNGGYSNYQSCNSQGSDFMPITNDFSQFT